MIARRSWQGLSRLARARRRQGSGGAPTATGPIRWTNPDDAASIASAVGAGVETYADVSSVGGASWVQATAGKRPILRQDNGVKWVEFDGTDDEMTLATGSLKLVGTHLFTIVKFDNFTNEGPILGNTAVNVQVSANTAAAARVVGSPVIWNNALFSADATLTAGKWVVAEAHLMASGTSFLAIDGVEVATTTEAQGTAVAIDLLGARFPRSGADTFHNGGQAETRSYLAEAAPYPQAATVRAELAAKAALLNVPGSVVTVDSAPVAVDGALVYV